MSKKSDRLLFRIAAGQHGFFTTAQAVEAGYRDNVHSYHLRNGDWIRVIRGIYRLAQYPDVGRGELEAARLWTRNRAGEEEGVFSHATALELHGRAEPGDGTIHVTVPARFRRNSKPPAGVVLHKADIAAKDIEVIDGFRVTGLIRTVADLQEAGEALNIQRPTSLVHHSPARDGGNIQHRSAENSDSAGGRQAPAAVGGQVVPSVNIEHRSERMGKAPQKKAKTSRSRPVARTKPKSTPSPEPAGGWGGAKIW